MPSTTPFVKNPRTRTIKSEIWRRVKPKTPTYEEMIERIGIYNARTKNVHLLRRPDWVTENRWRKGWADEEKIPALQQVELYQQRWKIIVVPRSDERFDAILRIVFPRREERVYRVIMLWLYRDRIEFPEIARRIRTSVSAVREIYTKAEKRFRSWMHESGFEDEMRVAGRRMLDQDENLEEEAREEVGGTFYRG